MRGSRPRLALGALLATALSCGGARAPVDRPGADEAVKSASPAPATPKKDEKKKSDDPLFPTRQGGWKHVDVKAVRGFAAEYLAFLSRAQTPRRAIAALVDTARAGGAVVVSGAEPVAAGGFYVSVDRGGTAAAFFRPGKRPVTDGLQVIMVSVDAPRIVLKQRPISEAHGFAMLQTRLHGYIDLASWMVHPLALFVYVDRRAGKPTDLALGIEPGDPVLSIPDVLPHLARGVQSRRQPVKDPERLDALAARTRAALVEALAARGVSDRDLSVAEAYLIPASRPVYVGPDRGLIGGYGQARRALAFAAIRGLAAASPDRAAVVVAIDRSDAGGDGAAGRGYVRRALSDVIARLAPEADVYDLQRTLSRSSALVASTGDKGRNQGVQVNLRASDSMPAAVAALTRALDGAGVHYQLATAGGRSPAREIGTLDLDVIDVAIAVTGAGTPGELLSVLDLFQGYQACRAWLSR